MPKWRNAEGAYFLLYEFIYTDTRISPFLFSQIYSNIIRITDHIQAHLEIYETLRIPETRILCPPTFQYKSIFESTRK